MVLNCAKNTIAYGDYLQLSTDDSSVTSLSKILYVCVRCQRKFHSEYLPERLALFVLLFIAQVERATFTPLVLDGADSLSKQQPVDNHTYK